MQWHSHMFIYVGRISECHASLVQHDSHSCHMQVASNMPTHTRISRPNLSPLMRLTFPRFRSALHGRVWSATTLRFRTTRPCSAAFHLITVWFAVRLCAPRRTRSSGACNRALACDFRLRGEAGPPRIASPAGESTDRPHARRSPDTGTLCVFTMGIAV